ncbi:hypothetical protein [Jiangella sp. DSM 45060]|uniref:hypothetical protein n=1 Tax=Jiangella sp. DSM 45060 TaxID=1798224 RepID=UPI000879B07F|nr:hypothetical protein [Jiangella sp. DSM 45060]SDS40104.1 hypothetical protein SAMN04515669_1014 [Jiangella sp. DSM 45060]
MALTPGSGDDHDLGTAVVDRAASALRGYTDHGWTTASRRILQSVLTATRRSRPVRAHDGAGVFHVSDQVVTSHLQHAVDGIDGVQATHVRLDLDDDVLASLMVTVAVRYPEPVHPLAESVRRAAYETVRSVLGERAPPLPAARIHVHFGDVDAWP